MTEFLALYDCGMGGLWAVIEAPSAEAITNEYPEVSVVSERPEWLDDSEYATLERLSIVGEPQGMLKTILDSREGG